jgi:hypothetical protein
MPDIELHITDNLYQPTDPDIEITIFVSAMTIQSMISNLLCEAGKGVILAF